MHAFDPPACGLAAGEEGFGEVGFDGQNDLGGGEAGGLIGREGEDGGAHFGVLGGVDGVGLAGLADVLDEDLFGHAALPSRPERVGAGRAWVKPG